MLDAEFYDSLDQPVGDGLVEGKLQVALWACVGRDGFHHGCITFYGRVKADVFFESGKVDEDATLSEGGHGIADDLFGGWCGTANGLPNLLQNGLDFRSGPCDVLIDRRGFWSGCHGISLRFGFCCGGGFFDEGRQYLLVYVGELLDVDAAFSGGVFAQLGK